MRINLASCKYPVCEMAAGEPDNSCVDVRMPGWLHNHHEAALSHI